MVALGGALYQMGRARIFYLYRTSIAFGCTPKANHQAEARTRLRKVRTVETVRTIQIHCLMLKHPYEKQRKL